MKMTSRAPLFFGWKVAGAAFVVAVFSWGIGFYGPPVFLQTLHADRGWSVSLVSSAITAHYLFSAVLLARLADLHARFGVAAVTRAGAVATAAGLLAWAFAPSPWLLFAAAFVSSAGWAATGLPAINAMISPWFDRRRPAALGHALNGASVGGIVFTPLWTWLIAAVGFGAAAAVVGLAVVVVFWPLAGRYLAPTPASLGLHPDGAPALPLARGGRVPTGTGTTRATFRNPRFLSLATAFSLGLFAQIGLVAHLIARLAPVLGSTGAAWAVSLVTGCAVLGRLLVGAFLGGFDRRVATALTLFMQAIGVGLLAGTDTSVGLVLGCVLFGLGLGVLITLPPLIVQSEFPAPEVGRVVALVTAVSQTVFAFSPAVFGGLRDLSGSYTPAFALAVLCEVGGGVVLLATRPRPGGSAGRR